MPREYSIYDAKAQLSALVRQVRESGQTFVITVHGEPAAELRPIEPVARHQTFEERIAELTALGAIIPAARKPSDPEAFKMGKRKKGALKRFLDDR
jgi:prevent-host-death family protein